jgi:hypothetical protein
MDGRLRVLDELGAEFERLSHRRRSRRPMLIAAVAAALALAGVALAASGLLEGKPVPEPKGQRPDVGAGVATGSALLPLRVSDPGGGPPWGIRRLRTSRGLGCLQVGRVVEGRLGVLGQDGAFGDDERFHELRPSPANAFCEQTDAAGHLFIAISYQGLHASGSPAGCSIAQCPAADDRIGYFGAVGPEAASVTDAKNTDHPVAGDDGVYLVISRPRAGHTPRGTFSPSLSPLSGLRRVNYRDGSSCVIPSPQRLDGGRPCPLRGYVDRRETRVTRDQVRTPIRVRLLGPRVPKGLPASSPKTRVLVLRLRARVPVNSTSYYVATTRVSGGHGCDYVDTSSSQRDRSPGQTVTIRTFVSLGCRGPIRGAIRYRPAPARPGSETFPALGGGALVGRFRTRVP